MALILPSSAVITNTTKEKEIDPLWVDRDRIEINEAITWSIENKPLPLLQLMRKTFPGLRLHFLVAFL